MIAPAKRARPLGAIAALIGLVLALFLLSSARPARGETMSSRQAIASLPIVTPKRSCDDLAQFDILAIGGAGSRITQAKVTTDGNGGACSVEGTLAPSIKFRVILPMKSWTQRYLQTGCGGLCGSLNIRVGAADGCPTVKANGFVTASTDMGHEGPSGEFGLDPQKRADFAYRGVHLTALAAKALIRVYYGQAERYAYFDGCSDGGREALVEAQRYPDDFNGIIAGAPAMNFQVQNSLYHGWQARSNTGADGQAILLAPRLPILHDAVLKACDALDGLADGIVSQPGRCRFDPKSIVCRAGQAPTTCFTAAEAEVARKLYEGPRDPQTGVRLTQGQPLYGSELQWSGVYVPRAAGQPIFSGKIVSDALPMIFGDKAPTLATLGFDSATFALLRDRHPFFDATSPDLAAFAARGGKLILFHGLADPHISPLNTVAYHDALRRQMGAKADLFERLYLMPGMGHCSGGEGPNLFDLLTPMMAWVERDHAPETIMTRQEPVAARSDFGLPTNGPPSSPDAPRPPLADRPPGALAAPPGQPALSPGPKRARPLYPYPYVAAYRGKGDPNDAASFTRGAAVPLAVPTWAGDDFYRPYAGATG